MKSCAREKIDGTWSTMVKAVWQACGQNNISPDLCRRFARKVREMISLYAHGTSGPFAIWCQKKMNGHRVSFFNANALQQWKVGSVATCTVTDYGVKQYLCTLTRIDTAACLCDLDFGAGRCRFSVPFEELKTPNSKAK